MSTIREKTEQAIVPIKAELIWFVLLLLAVTAAIVGMKATYRVGYKDGVVAEKIGILEDHDIARKEVKNASSE